MTPPVVVTPVRRPGPRHWVHGVLAVGALLLSAVGALLSAVTGWHPGRVARELGRAIADEWHRGARTMPPPRAWVTVTEEEDTPR